MKVITSVHEKTGVKLGPQEFLILTLEQMADKIASKHAFEDASETAEPKASVAEVANVVAAAPEVQPVAKEDDQPAQQPESETLVKNAFRYIKGFWN